MFTVPHYTPAMYPTAAELKRYAPDSIDGIPAYVNPQLDRASRKMVVEMIRLIPRFKHIHVCPDPRNRSRKEVWHNLDIDPLWIGIKVYCWRCQAHYRYTKLSEDERRFLKRVHPGYGRVDISPTPMRLPVANLDEPKSYPTPGLVGEGTVNDPIVID
ncbi:hypothetical protein K435DRAFT_874871 [Dendrothele bispora CBS 962.96]|uniref:Uncharacterized protein n=1 Tax=Dendrothele bispora (strain CBS 962.96) TaxID=1314807 RepID=A0A4S8KVL2_DENBC|nr:hypothetical protein K435DRAFT_874871 [Dendrothele bispora CBS 962.96]